MKPANAKAWALFRKLQALAEQGVDGERIQAQRKLASLRERFDFSYPDPASMPDLFAGRFKRASKAKPIYAFQGHELDVANSVKWAIESATQIPCSFRNGDLMAEATAGASRQLRDIAAHIANSFRALLERFSQVEGVGVTDRSAFVMGLYDGMMNQTREPGQRLPNRVLPKKSKTKKQAAVCAPTLNIHPYTMAIGLGKQIRFAAPLEHITAELDSVTRKHLTAPTGKL